MAFANNPRIVNSGGDSAPEIIHGLLEASTQSFKAGELVYGDAGALTAVASNDVLVLGIAQIDATGATTHEVPVMRIRPSDIVKMRVSNAGTAATSDNCKVGEPYALDVTSNVVTVDYSDTGSNDAVVCVGHANQTTSASTYTYWGLFQFIPTVCQSATGG